MEDGIIYAEDGEDFQEYVDKNGKKIPGGTPVGIEVFNGKEWELKLLSGIYYKN